MAIKPPRWNISPALIAPEARALWKDVAFVAPLWDVAGGKGALLNALGQPLAGADLVAGATAVKRGTPYGLGVGISGASNLLTQTDFAPVTTSDGAGTGDFTVLILANPPAESRASVGVSQKSSAGTPRLDVAFNSNTGLTASSGTLSLIPGGGGGTYPSLANAVDGLYHLFAGQRAGAELSLWVDGAKRASTTTSVNDVWSDITGFSIGNLGESASGARISTATNIVFAAGWNRALSGAEMRMLARDPFCMFRPMPEWRGVWGSIGQAISRAVAWRIYNRAAKTAAWRISARQAKPAAWRIFTRAAKTAAWRVLARAARAAAWSILNTLQAAKAVAWRIAGRAAKTAGWRVMARADRSSTWRIFSRAGRASAWRNITRAARAVSWRLGPLPSVSADVHLFAMPHTRNFSVAGHARHFYATAPKR